jgi:hypothetical protein
MALASWAKPERTVPRVKQKPKTAPPETKRDAAAQHIEYDLRAGGMSNFCFFIFFDTGYIQVL